MRAKLVRLNLNEDILKEEITPADQGLDAARRDAARREEPENVKVVDLMIRLQNIIQDVFESDFDIKMDSSDEQLLSNVSKWARRKEIEYGDENHGITSVFNKTS